MESTYLKEPAPYRFFKAENINFYAHFHQQVEVVYCISGEVHLRIDGFSYILKEGDVALIFSNRHHYYQPVEPGKTNQVYLLLFYPSHTENFYSEWIHKLPKEPVLRCEQLPDFFSQLWEQFYEVYKDNQELYMFKAYASLLTAHMMSVLKCQPLYSRNLSAGLKNDSLQAVLNYVNQHFTEKISLTSVAKELGYEPTVLSREFSKTMGNNFINHVNSLRISYARRLLRTTDYSINEVGFLSGFQSNRTFFRNFQKVCGQTPSQYRLEIRK